MGVHLAYKNDTQYHPLVIIEVYIETITKDTKIKNIISIFGKHVEK